MPIQALRQPDFSAYFSHEQFSKMDKEKEDKLDKGGRGPYYYASTEGLNLNNAAQKKHDIPLDASSGADDEWTRDPALQSRHSSSSPECLDLNKEDQNNFEDIGQEASSDDEDDDEWSNVPFPVIACGCLVVSVQQHRIDCKQRKARFKENLEHKVRNKLFCAKIRELEKRLKCQVEGQDKEPSAPKNTTP